VSYKSNAVISSKGDVTYVPPGYSITCPKKLYAQNKFDRILNFKLKNYFDELSLPFP
jgi:hypothetical protein